MWNSEYWNTVWKRPYGRYNHHHQEIWEAIFPLLRGKICDLGCGPAMIYAGKTGIDLTGVDFSTTAIEEAKKNYPQGKYYVAEVTKTPFLDNTFDTVVILGVLDYFSPWDSVLDEARRICKPDGWILATLLHGFQGHDWKQYKHLTGNWYLFYESSNNRDGLGRTGDAQDIPGRSPV